jgi:hypothetical protein
VTTREKFKLKEEAISDLLKKNEMGGTHSTYGGEEG